MPSRPRMASSARIGILIGDVLSAQIADEACRMRLAFLDEVADQASSSRDDCKPAHDVSRNANLQQQRRNRAGRIDCQMTAARAIHFSTKTLQQIDVGPRET